MVESDGQLVRLVIAGDVERYSVLVERYRDRLGRYAYRMLGNLEDAEEVLQDTFVRAYKSLRNCQDPELFGRWIFKILINRARTAGSIRGRRDRLFVTDEISILNASSSREAEYGWREEIERAVAELPADQREAFVLKYVEELRYDEIADLTGVGVSALKMRVNRACKRLREALEGIYRG